jgi:hypothetical protein
MVSVVGEACDILQRYSPRLRLIARAVGENNTVASRLDGLRRIEAARPVKRVKLLESQSGCLIVGKMRTALLGCDRDVVEILPLRLCGRARTTYRAHFGYRSQECPAIVRASEYSCQS